jgi:tight junction protein 1
MIILIQHVKYFVTGEELLSPLVLCGPHGLHFLIPVELRLPAAASLVQSTPSPEERWSLTLRAGDVDEKLHWLEPTSFCAVPRRVGSHISVFVDHF